MIKCYSGITPEFLCCLTISPEERVYKDVSTIYAGLRQHGLFQDKRYDDLENSQVLGLCKQAMYESHGPNDILYCRGELISCWYILLTGSVDIDGIKYLPFSRIGIPLNNKLNFDRRTDECLVLEYSEFLVITGHFELSGDYDCERQNSLIKNAAAKKGDLFFEEKNNHHFPPNSSYSFSNSDYLTNSNNNASLYNHHMIFAPAVCTEDLKFSQITPPSPPTSKMERVGENNVTYTYDDDIHLHNVIQGSTSTIDINIDNTLLFQQHPPSFIDSSNGALTAQTSYAFNKDIKHAPNKQQQHFSNQHIKVLLSSTLPYRDDDLSGHYGGYNYSSSKKAFLRECLETHPTQRTEDDLAFMRHYLDLSVVVEESAGTPETRVVREIEPIAEGILDCFAHYCLNYEVNESSDDALLALFKRLWADDQDSRTPNASTGVVGPKLLTLLSLYRAFVADFCALAILAEVPNPETIVLNRNEQLDSWCLVFNGTIRIEFFDGNNKYHERYLKVGDAFGVKPNLGPQFFDAVMKTVTASSSFLCIGQVDFHTLISQYHEIISQNCQTELGRLNVGWVGDSAAGVVSKDKFALRFVIEPSTAIVGEENEEEILDNCSINFNEDDTILDAFNSHHEFDFHQRPKFDSEEENYSAVFAETLTTQDRFSRISDEIASRDSRYLSSNVHSGLEDDISSLVDASPPITSDINSLVTGLAEFNFDGATTTLCMKSHKNKLFRLDFNDDDQQFLSHKYTPITDDDTTISTNSNAVKQQIKKGTVKELLEYLINDNCITNSSVASSVCDGKMNTNLLHTNYIEDFLLTYRVFIPSPLVVAAKLQEWFLNYPENKAKATRILLLWVNNHFGDFEKIPKMTEFLENFEALLEKEKMQGQLTLLNMACYSKAGNRIIILTRSMKDDCLNFSILGGWERQCPIYVSKVEKDSKAYDLGLKRGDQIIEVNGQNFEYISHSRALDIFRTSTHLSITVKSNILGFKQFLATSSQSPSRSNASSLNITTTTDFANSNLDLIPFNSHKSSIPKLNTKQMLKNSIIANNNSNRSPYFQHGQLSCNPVGSKNLFSSFWKGNKAKVKKALLSYQLEPRRTECDKDEDDDISSTEKPFEEKQQFESHHLKQDIDRFSNSSPSISSKSNQSTYSSSSNNNVNQDKMKSYMNSLPKSCINGNYMKSKSRYSFNSSLMESHLNPGKLIMPNSCKMIESPSSIDFSKDDQSFDSNVPQAKIAVKPTRVAMNSVSTSTDKTLSMYNNVLLPTYNASNTDFPENVIKVFKGPKDPIHKYLLIHKQNMPTEQFDKISLPQWNFHISVKGEKETTAKEVVMLSLREFGINDPSNLFSLFEVTVQNGGALRRKRLPEHLNNLADRMELTSRYYIKRNFNSSTLSSMPTSKNSASNINVFGITTPSNAADLIPTNNNLNDVNTDFSELATDKSLVNELIEEAGLNIENQGTPSECYKIDLLSLKSYELALQLTLRDFDAFRKIEPSEYMNDLFKLKPAPKDLKMGKDTAETMIPDSFYSTLNLTNFEKSVDSEMFWVINEIVKEHKNLVRRSRKLKYFLKLANLCGALNNFNTAFAICSGLTHSTVSRLELTWSKLPGKYKALYEELLALMDPSRNMANYRNNLKRAKLHPPLIPFFPLLKKDLTFLHLGNPTYLDTQDAVATVTQAYNLDKSSLSETVGIVQDDGANVKEELQESTNIGSCCGGSNVLTASLSREQEIDEKMVVNFDKMHMISREIHGIQGMCSIPLDFKLILDNCGPHSLTSSACMYKNWTALIKLREKRRDGNTEDFFDKTFTANVTHQNGDETGKQPPFQVLPVSTTTILPPIENKASRRFSLRQEVANLDCVSIDSSKNIENFSLFDHIHNTSSNPAPHLNDSIFLNAKQIEDGQNIEFLNSSKSDQVAASNLKTILMQNVRKWREEMKVTKNVKDRKRVLTCNSANVVRKKNILTAPGCESKTPCSITESSTTATTSGPQQPSLIRRFSAGSESLAREIRRNLAANCNNNNNAVTKEESHFKRGSYNTNQDRHDSKDDVFNTTFSHFSSYYEGGHGDSEIVVSSAQQQRFNYNCNSLKKSKKCTESQTAIVTTSNQSMFSESIGSNTKKNVDFSAFTTTLGRLGKLHNITAKYNTAGSNALLIDNNNPSNTFLKAFTQHPPPSPLTKQPSSSTGAYLQPTPYPKKIYEQSHSIRRARTYLQNVFGDHQQQSCRALSGFGEGGGLITDEEVLFKMSQNCEPKSIQLSTAAEDGKLSTGSVENPAAILQTTTNRLFLKTISQNVLGNYGAETSEKGGTSSRKSSSGRSKQETAVAAARTKRLASLRAAQQANAETLAATAAAGSPKNRSNEPTPYSSTPPLPLSPKRSNIKFGGGILKAFQNVGQQLPNQLLNSTTAATTLSRNSADDRPYGILSNFVVTRCQRKPLVGVVGQQLGERSKNEPFPTTPPTTINTNHALYFKPSSPSSLSSQHSQYKYPLVSTLSPTKIHRNPRFATQNLCDVGEAANSKLMSLSEGTRYKALTTLKSPLQRPRLVGASANTFGVGAGTSLNSSNYDAFNKYPDFGINSPCQDKTNNYKNEVSTTNNSSQHFRSVSIDSNQQHFEEPLPPLVFSSSGYMIKSPSDTTPITRFEFPGVSALEDRNLNRNQIRGDYQAAESIQSLSSSSNFRSVDSGRGSSELSSKHNSLLYYDGCSMMTGPSFPHTQRYGPSSSSLPNVISDDDILHRANHLSFSGGEKGEDTFRREEDDNNTITRTGKNSTSLVASNFSSVVPSMAFPIFNNSSNTSLSSIKYPNINMPGTPSSSPHPPYQIPFTTVDIYIENMNGKSDEENSSSLYVLPPKDYETSPPNSAEPQLTLKRR